MAKGRGEKNTAILALIKKKNQHGKLQQNTFMPASNGCDLAKLALKIEKIPPGSLNHENRNLIEETVHHLKYRTEWKGRDFESAIAILKMLFYNDAFCAENILHKHGFTCVLLQVFFSQLRNMEFFIYNESLHSEVAGFKDPRVITQIPGHRKVDFFNKKNFETKCNAIFNPVIQLLKEFQKTSYEINSEQLKNFTLSIHKQILNSKRDLKNITFERIPQTASNQKMFDFLDKKWEQLFVVLQQWIGPISLSDLENASEPSLLLAIEAEKLMESFPLENSLYQNADCMLRFIYRSYKSQQPLHLTIVQLIFKKFVASQCVLLPAEKSTNLLQNLEEALFHLENMICMLGVTEYEINLAQMMADLNQQNKDLEPQLFDRSNVKPLSDDMKKIWLIYGAPVTALIESLKQKLSQFSEFINEVYETDLSTENYNKRALVEICYHTAFVIVEKIMKPRLAAAIQNQDENERAQLIKLYDQICRIVLNTSQKIHGYFHPARTGSLPLFGTLLDVGFTMSYLPWSENDAFLFQNDTAQIYQEITALCCEYREQLGKDQQRWTLLFQRAELLMHCINYSPDDYRPEFQFLMESVKYYNEGYCASIDAQDGGIKVLLWVIEQWFTQLFDAWIQHPLFKQQDPDMHALKEILSDFSKIINCFISTHVFEVSFLFQALQPTLNAIKNIPLSSNLSDFQFFLEEQQNIEQWSKEYKNDQSRLYEILISSQASIKDLSFFHALMEKFNLNYLQKSEFFEQEKQKLIFFQFILNNDLSAKNPLLDFYYLIKKLHISQINPHLQIMALFDQLRWMSSELTIFSEKPSQYALLNEIHLRWKKELFIAAVNVLLQDFYEIVLKIKKSVTFFLDNKGALLDFFSHVDEFLTTFALSPQPPKLLKVSLERFYELEKIVSKFERKPPVLPKQKIIPHTPETVSPLPEMAIKQGTATTSHEDTALSSQITRSPKGASVTPASPGHSALKAKVSNPHTLLRNHLTQTRGLPKNQKGSKGKTTPPTVSEKKLKSPSPPAKAVLIQPPVAKVAPTIKNSPAPTAQKKGAPAIPKVPLSQKGNANALSNRNQPAKQKIFLINRTTYSFTLNDYIQAALAQGEDTTPKILVKPTPGEVKSTAIRRIKTAENKGIVKVQPHPPQQQMLSKGFLSQYERYQKKLAICQNGIAVILTKMPALKHPFLIDELYFLLNQYLHTAAHHCTIILGVMNGVKSHSTEKINTLRSECSEILLTLIVQIQELPWKYAQVHTKKRDYSITQKMAELINAEYKIKQLSLSKPLSDSTSEALVNYDPDFHKRLELELQLHQDKKGLLLDLLMISKDKALNKELSEFLNYTHIPNEDLPCAQAYLYLNFIHLYETFSYFDFTAFQHYLEISELSRTLNPQNCYLLNAIKMQLSNEYPIIHAYRDECVSEKLAHYQWTLLAQFYGHLLQTLEILSGFMQGGPTLNLIELTANALTAMELLEEQEQVLLICADKKPIQEWALSSLDNLRNLLLFQERTLDLLSKFHRQPLASSQPSVAGLYGSANKREEGEIVAPHSLSFGLT